MSQNLERLKQLLAEMFQLDQADLDFGIYRIMNTKRQEITRFLDRDLLPQVQDALGRYEEESRAILEDELTKAKEQARQLGFADPTQAPRVRELEARYRAAFDLEAAEQDVYSHLYNFFRRYYQEGDFISLRRYKEGVYAIPYEGEEVKLYWANHDQYYVKTSEYLRNYTFKLRSGKRVHFKLVEADTEKDNNRPAEGNERRFILSQEQPLVEENGELVVRFEYRPHPDRAKQAELNAAAVDRILNWITGFDDWRRELAALRPTEKNPNRTLLEKHLADYTARNTFDYFIHKDLGGFLRRELDFYIKNEVMHLDDIESETAPRVEQYLSKIKVIRRIASMIIDFLAQLEDFQRKLWLKKKFVVQSHYLFTLSIIPEKFYPEIGANQDVIDEWIRLFRIDEAKGDLTAPAFSRPLSVEFLRAHPTLVLDTRLLDRDLEARIVESVDSLDSRVLGILMSSENFHALSLITARFRSRVNCVYIDPPFNTGDDFAYKDSYQTSSWLALMDERLRMLRDLLSPAGHLFLHLDDNSNALGKMLLADLFSDITELIFDTNATKDPESGLFSYKSFGQRFVRQHDTIFHCMLSTQSFRKLWKPNRNTSKLGLGQMDLIGNPRTSPARRLEDFRFVVEKWVGTRIEECDVQVGGEKVFPLGDLWTDLYSFTQSEMRTSENVSFPTQKPEHLLRRIIQSASRPGDLILDVFAGSGTTACVAHKLGRRYVAVEMGEYFDTWYLAAGEAGYEWRLGLLGRMKNVLHGDVQFFAGDKARRSGLSKAINWGGGGALKYLTLESYEDTLNNLELRRTKEQQGLLDQPEAQGADSLKEQYMLRYMLDVETRGSQSLLNVAAFTDPTAYTLKVTRPGSDASREVNVDLLETFNWLIGLTVQHIAAPQTFAAEFERDGECRLRLKGRLKQAADGRWWFRTVTGTTPDGRKTLIIWRKRPGGEAAEGIEQDNLVLDEWFTRQGYSSKDSEFDLIYVNGDNNLENLKAPDDTWKVRLIEEDFFRLMFETEGV